MERLLFPWFSPSLVEAGQGQARCHVEDHPVVQRCCSISVASGANFGGRQSCSNPCCSALSGCDADQARGKRSTFRVLHSFQGLRKTRSSTLARLACGHERPCTWAVTSGKKKEEVTDSILTSTHLSKVNEDLGQQLRLAVHVNFAHESSDK